MVKIKSPLHSETASGTICGVLTFSNRKSGQQVRVQKKQKDKKSSAQLDNRILYNQAVSAWGELSTAQKSQWTRNARGQNITGFNLYISIYLGEYYQENQPAIYGEAIFGTTNYGKR